MAEQVQWHLTGDYFENCNCTVVCPCLVSKAAPLTARPTEGVCDVPLIFHIESGKYGNTSLDGLNVVVAVHTPDKHCEPEVHFAWHTPSIWLLSKSNRLVFHDQLR